MLFFSPQAAPKPELFFSVFGIDQRREIDLYETPYQAIGRIELQPHGVLPWKNPHGTPICTGSLISRDLVLTNSHCVLDHSSEAFTDRTIWFRPALGKQKTEIGARAIKVWLGTLQPSKQRSHDWAILKLDRPLGETYGWLDPAPLGEDDPSASHLVSFIAYATDFKDGSVALIHSNCALTSFDRRGSYFRHSCHMNAGSSGGPLLGFRDGKPHILAINAAHVTPTAVSYLPEFSPRFANIAIGSTRFTEAIFSLRTETPSPVLQQLTFFDLTHDTDNATPTPELAVSPSSLPHAH